MRLRTKRIYETAEAAGGRRVLVDRLWPRGLSKEDVLNNAAALVEYLGDRS